MYAFQSDSALYGCLNVKELLETGVKSEVLSDCNGTRTHNHLIHKGTLTNYAVVASSPVPVT